jgi:transcriptional regulator with PAS, ATPase and Fis domain
MSSTISSRRAAQESLDSVLQENQLLHSVTECLCDMVTVTNAQGKIIWATGSIESLMGRPMRETVGLNVFELEPSGIVSRSTSVLVLKTGQGHTLLQKTCTGRQLLVSAWPVFGKNRGLEKVINISRDVTQMDRVKERLREGEVLRERVRQDWLSDRALPATSGFLTQGSKMQRVLELVHRVADVSTTVPRGPYLFRLLQRHR